MYRGYGRGRKKYRTGYKAGFSIENGKKHRKKKDLGWIKDVLAVLLFLLLFPYFAISFKEQKDEYLQREARKEMTVSRQSANNSDSSPATGAADRELMERYEQLLELPQNKTYSVIWQEDSVQMKLPVEIFLVGALAASVDAGYEKEVLKAQAIVLRSTLCQAYESEKQVTLDKKTGSYWSDVTMQEAWGKDYLSYLKKCVEAVWETQGVYMAYEGEAVNGCYHGMSAGETRTPEELSRQGEYNYLKVADCVDNLSAPDYTQIKEIKKEDIGELELHERNEDGYVISLYQNGEPVSGESFREELALASSNFVWEEKGDKYIFTTKGKGHGFGLDQYYANILAKKGEDYQEILNYFFTDITFERME